jgi:HAD superfamily hydrolase (TIGR01458 family)
VTAAVGLIIDIDGTLYQGHVAVPGAARAVEALRSSGVPLLFATNTTRMPRTDLVDRLSSMGVEVRYDELFTAPVAAARWLRRRRVRRVSLLLAEATFEEFGAFEYDAEQPDAVVVGDLGAGWTFDVLNTAYRAISRGASLVAVQKNRTWDPGGGLQLDAGPFIVALEYACGVTAELVGKPSPAFYAAAVDRLGVAPEQVVAVGDSLENDVWGAQDAGCRGVLVKTGTFRTAQLGSARRQPHAVLDSIADLPEWLAQR